jgi:NodT family efflux transporter outer membrane factor (OMF) lipoprotein
MAKTRIEQARAQQTLSQAAAIPNLAGSLGVSRARTDPTLPVANMLSGSLQASWEIDLWGSLSLGKNAANKRLQGSQASWHEARVSVAAEVASVYYNLINCERLANNSSMQVQSFKESQKLNDLLVKNGFMSQSQSSYAVLALSQSENNLAQINAQCRSFKNALFALTGLSEDKLASISANPTTSQFPSSVMMPVVPQVPAQLLAQRPDVWAAENEVAAASAEVGQANRQYLPRLSLSGSVTAIRANSSDLTANLKTWSVGPLAFTMPIFEGGKIAAQQQIANAQYDQAVVVYQAKVRQAVQETQDALSQLQATDEQAQSALAGFKAASQILKSAELQLKQGMLSGLQLEEAKRQMLSSKMALQTAELNRMNAWIGLYRVLGGGWNSNTTTNTTTHS